MFKNLKRIKADKGSFICPTCRNTKQYTKYKVLDYWTIGKVNILPKGVTNIYVECKHCEGTFEESVLDVMNDHMISVFEQTMKDTIVMMMMIDDKIKEVEKQAVLFIINKYSHQRWSLWQIDQKINAYSKNGFDYKRYFKEVEGKLNEKGKTLLLRCLYQVSMADGYYDDREREMLEYAAELFDVKKATLHQIQDEASSFNREFSRNF